jgi:hypothetical protein
MWASQLIINETIDDLARIVLYGFIAKLIIAYSSTAKTMIRLAGSLLTTPLTRRLIPRSAFHSVAASTASGTSVSSRNVPRIALACNRAFGTEAGSGSGEDADDKRNLKHDRDLTNIYIQNQIWKKKHLEEDPDFFKKLGSGHSPDYMWIGKSVELIATGSVCEASIHPSSMLCCTVM